jgi:hypothetical protein
MSQVVVAGLAAAWAVAAEMGIGKLQPVAKNSRMIKSGQAVKAILRFIGLPSRDI